MSQRVAWGIAEQRIPDPCFALPIVPLATIVYRSRAVQPLSGTELHWLLQVAQCRNRLEGITGVIVYDDGIFHQWMEGPRDNLTRVMDSIRRDPRHEGVEILDERTVGHRHFSGWPMKLATRLTRPAPPALHVIDAPAAIMQDLRSRPDLAPAALMRLRRSSAVIKQDEFGLQDFVHGILVPQIMARHAHASIRPDMARAGHLARLLVAADAAPAMAMLMQHGRRASSLQAVFGGIVEPCARALGDLWIADVCSEFDVAIGLTRLQGAMRLMPAMQDLPAHADQPPPSVLVVPEPGERHRLGAALHGDMLWHAGWTPRCEFPTSDAALQALVGDTWFDAVDLSLSIALRREHFLPRVKATIEMMRRASRNPGLVVVVGGRVFDETGGAAAQVGADATGSAWAIEHVIGGSVALRH